MISDIDLTGWAEKIDLTAFAAPFRDTVSVELSHGLRILRLSLHFPTLTDPVGVVRLD